MSRVSDTRLRTRQAASRLVTTGRRPHELTVDLIYADIKQGSRTTINDELKLWKDELAKADALTSALPPAVASAMLNIWAVAVEYGEKVFDQQREETETQLAQVTIHLEALKVEKSKLTQQVENLQADTAQSHQALAPHARKINGFKCKAAWRHELAFHARMIGTALAAQPVNAPPKRPPSLRPVLWCNNLNWQKLNQNKRLLS